MRWQSESGCFGFPVYSTSLPSAPILLICLASVGITQFGPNVVADPLKDVILVDSHLYMLIAGSIYLLPLCKLRPV